jgi:hypothetical protein
VTSAKAGGARLRTAAVLALFALGIAACERASEVERAAEPDGASGGAPRLVLLGIDGATWKVIGPLLERGALPHFARLEREGACMRRFETLESTDSPVVWTTVATGRDVDDHGIRGFKQTLPDGEVIPVSSNSRRAVAIWEVASRHGTSVGVVNWWASWPAEEVQGYVISDHASPALAEFLVEDQRYWTADRERLAALRRDFFPLDLAPLLARVWLRPDDFPYAEMQRRGDFTDEQMAVLRATPWNRRTAYSILKTFYAADLPLMQAAIRLRRERPVRLQMIYLRGPDPVQHYAWDRVEPEKFARVPATLARDRGMVEGVYRVLDGLLGELLASLEPDTWLIVASDHGAEPVAEAGDPDRSERPGGHSPAAKGVLFLHGPHVRPGHAIGAADPADLMPTMLWLLGLPLSEELEGQPIREAFDAEFVASQPVRQVATYGVRPTRPGLPSPADASMLERLRALGYIE